MPVNFFEDELESESGAKMMARYYIFKSRLPFSDFPKDSGKVRKLIKIQIFQTNIFYCNIKYSKRIIYNYFIMYEYLNRVFAEKTIHKFIYNALLRNNHEYLNIVFYL